MKLAQFLKRKRDKLTVSSEAIDMDPGRLLMGVIASVHGVRGEVRVKSFTTDPDNLPAYGPFTDASGVDVYNINVTGHSRGLLLGRVNDVRDRNSAEALVGTELYVERDILPPAEEDEFYYADLVGLNVVLETGEVFGRVKSVQEYGAGDVLEIIGTDGQTNLLPFTRKIFPVVEMNAGCLVVVPPEIVEGRENRQRNGVEYL